VQPGFLLMRSKCHSHAVLMGKPLMHLMRNPAPAIVCLVVGAVCVAVSCHAAELVWDGESGWSTDGEGQLSEADGLYKHGRVLFVKGETLAAIDVFEAIEEKYPASASAAKAKIARARCLERLGRFDEAIRVCDEAMALAANERPVLEIILFQIDILEKMSLTNPVRATELLTRVSESAPGEEIRSAANAAAQNARNRIADKSPAPAPDMTVPLVPEAVTDETLALFKLALEDLWSCREGMHDQDRLLSARARFQAFMDSNPDVKQDVAHAYLRAIDSILDTTDTDHRAVYYAMTYMPEERYAEADRVFQQAAKRFRTTPIGEVAQFQHAECLYLRGSFWKAFRAYENLIESHTSTGFLPTVCAREFAIAEAFLEQEKPRKAITVLSAVMNNDPTGPLADDAQMYIGRAYMDQKKYTAAKEAFSFIVQNFSSSEWSNAAIFFGGKADLLNAELSSDAEELLSKAREAFELYLWEAPKGAFADEAKTLLQDSIEQQARALWDIAQSYEKRRKYQAAVWYYGLVAREYPDSPQAGLAVDALRTYGSLGFRTP